MSCKIHKIREDPFWKGGISQNDLEEGLYNCIDCGITIEEGMKFKIIKQSQPKQEAEND